MRRTVLAAVVAALWLAACASHPVDRPTTPARAAAPAPRSTGTQTSSTTTTPAASAASLSGRFCHGVLDAYVLQLASHRPRMQIVDLRFTFTSGRETPLTPLQRRSIEENILILVHDFDFAAHVTRRTAVELVPESPDCQLVRVGSPSGPNWQVMTEHTPEVARYANLEPTFEDHIIETAESAGAETREQLLPYLLEAQRGAGLQADGEIAKVVRRIDANHYLVTTLLGVSSTFENHSFAGMDAEDVARGFELDVSVEFPPDDNPLPAIPRFGANVARLYQREWLP